MSRIALTGSHGLVAGALMPALRARGDTVIRLVRGDATGPGEVSWDPGAGVLDPAALAGCDAVVHLAGVGIAAKRWNAAHKQAVLESRSQSTALLAATVAAMPDPPATLVSASAVGFYGNRDDELLTEASPSGSGFLAEVCRIWEAAAAPARDAGTRLVTLRTGVIQDAHGGSLAPQLPLFKLGLGTRLGRGRQWVPWISIDDEVGAILHALDHDDVSGPVNLVAPNPVTNAEYTRVLAHVLGRPAVLAVPPVALRLALGTEMADELLLASQRVAPTVLERTGYHFVHDSLEGALRATLGRPG